MYSWSPYARRPYSVIVDLPLPGPVLARAERHNVYIAEIALSSGLFVRVATEPYSTRITDSRPSIHFDGVMAKAPSWSVSLRNGSGFGGASSSRGPLAINNGSGDYDWLVDQSVDGALVTVMIVEQWGSYDAAVVIFTGVASGRPQDDGETLTISFRDDNKRLEIPASPNVYGGTGGLDGDSNAAGKSKPLCLGVPPNVELQLIDETNLVWQGHDGQMTGWSHVYVRGIEFAVDPANADKASYAALTAATITPGYYATCNASGLVRFGAKPDGTVTGTPSGGAVSDGTVAGSSTPGTALTDTASLVHYAIIHSGASIIVDTAAIIALKAAQPASIGYFVPAGDGRTAKQVIDDLTGGIGGYSYVRSDRSLTVGRVVLPTGTVVASFTDKDWYNSVQLGQLPEDFAVPARRMLVAYSRNFTQQADLDLTVDASTQTLRKDKYSVAVSTDTVTSAAIAVAFPNSADSAVMQSWFTLSADAVAEANRQLVLRGGAPRDVLRVTLGEEAFALNIGDVVQLTDGSGTPRYGLDVATPVFIIEIDNGFDDGEVVVEGLF